jgi:hypothetical protein
MTLKVLISFLLLLFKRIIILCKFSYNTDQFKDINIRTLSVMDKLDSKTIITEMISGLDIKAMSLDVETKIRDMQERYRTLAMYDIEVSV